MNRKKLILGTGTFVALTALALAHHVPVGLSYVSGAEILQGVVFFTGPGVFGVPAYKPGVAEAPDHGTPVGLVDGESFTVTDHNGASETITLGAADFADIATADMDEVVDVINGKATLFTAAETNGYFVMNGLVGGPAASIDSNDTSGGPLAKMGMGGGIAFGSDNLEMTVSIPDPLLDFSGRPYLVLVSSTPGSFTLQGHTIPIAIDALTQPFLAAARAGLAQGFKGVLNGTSDATAFLSGSNLQLGFAGNYPDKLYFTYLVFAPGATQIAYVSNVFTVDFQ